MAKAAFWTKAQALALFLYTTYLKVLLWITVDTRTSALHLLCGISQGLVATSLREFSDVGQPFSGKRIKGLPDKKMNTYIFIGGTIDTALLSYTDSPMN